MDELKECPFCGSDQLDLQGDDGGWHVYCMACSAMSGTYHTEKYAEDAWNMRHLTSQSSGREAKCPNCMTGTLKQMAICCKCGYERGCR